MENSIFDTDHCIEACEVLEDQRIVIDSELYKVEGVLHARRGFVTLAYPEGLPHERVTLFCTDTKGKAVQFNLSLDESIVIDY